jgi:hypothetical protein
MSAIDRPKLRLAVATLIAPVIPGVLFLCISMFGNLGEGLWALRLSALVGYPTMLALGLPAHLLLKSRGWTEIWQYLLAGLAVGIAIYLVLFFSTALNNFSFAPDVGKSLTSSGALLLVMAFLALLSSAVFWLIALPGRTSV